MYDDNQIFDVISIAGLTSGKMRGSSGYFNCPVCGGVSKFHIKANVGYGGVCRCAKCNVGGDKADLYALAVRGTACRLVTALSRKGNTYYRPSKDERDWAKGEIEERLMICRKNPLYVAAVEDQMQQAEKAMERESNSSRSPAERDAVYTAFLKLLTLSKEHREKLLERGLTQEEIDRILFRSTPQFGRPQIARQLIDQGLSLAGIAGFFKRTQLDEKTGEVTDQWSIYCPDAGYFVPIRNRDGHIISMQIRLNKPTTDKDKYRFFSSSRDTLLEGSMADSEIHVEMCGETPRFLYIVEGAIKAYVAHFLYRQIYGKDDIVILAIPGTSNQGGLPALMDWLLDEYDFDRVVEFFDLDKYVNKNVARDRDNLERLLKLCMKKWRRHKAEQYASGALPPSFVSFKRERYRGKGIDDHLKAIYDERKRMGLME